MNSLKRSELGIARNCRQHSERVLDLPRTLLEHLLGCS